MCRWWGDTNGFANKFCAVDATDICSATWEVCREHNIVTIETKRHRFNRLEFKTYTPCFSSAIKNSELLHVRPHHWRLQSNHLHNPWLCEVKKNRTLAQQQQLLWELKVEHPLVHQLSRIPITAHTTSLCTSLQTVHHHHYPPVSNTSHHNGRRSHRLCTNQLESFLKNQTKPHKLAHWLEVNPWNSLLGAEPNIHNL